MSMFASCCVALSMLLLCVSDDSCLTSCSCSSIVCNVNAVCSGRSWDFSVPVARLRDGLDLLSIVVTICRIDSVR